MTSLLAQFHTGLDRLARIIGHVLIRLVLVVLAAGITTSLLGGCTSTSASTPPAPASSAAPTQGQAQMVAIDVENRPTLAKALLRAGFRGDPSDSQEAIYVPVGTEVADAHDTWKVTPEGVVWTGAPGAPWLSPEGHERTALYWDGSAEYGNSAYGWDPDTHRFELR